jgi:hypothetical protein
MDLTLTNEQSNFENISNLLSDALFLFIVENLINDSNPTETYIIVEDNNHPISISELFEERREIQLLENCMRVIIY